MSGGGEMCQLCGISERFEPASISGETTNPASTSTTIIKAFIFDTIATQWPQRTLRRSKDYQPNFSVT